MTHSGCRFPLWPDRADLARMGDDEFRFCGLPCWPGHSYCARHLARCRGRPGEEAAPDPLPDSGAEGEAA